MRPDPSDDERAGFVEAAKRALIALRAGEDHLAVSEVRETAADRSPMERPREIMLLLYGACSSMVAALGNGGAAPVMVQVYDDAGDEVAIDDADPPVRTAVRALLAEVHGNTDAAREQLEIALDNASIDELASLMLQTLQWTSKLYTECVAHGLPVEDWVAEALG